MLGPMETAMAFAEEQQEETIADIKDSWLNALASCLPLFTYPQEFYIEYNPANWRISRQLAGLRRVSFMGEPYLIFEFSTPNSILPFDCFESTKAKQGVLAHEIAHIIDDARWNASREDLIYESNTFISREQRAELLAFIANPQAIYEANMALIASTAKTVNIDMAEFIEPFAAVETLGRIGMGRTDDLPSFFSEMEKKINVCKIFENYLSSNIFSFAGLVTPPNLNKKKTFGIKLASGLRRARKEVQEYLGNNIGRSQLDERLGKLGYAVKVPQHDAFQSVEVSALNARLCQKNLESSYEQFSWKRSRWSCYNDMSRAIKQALDSMQQHGGNAMEPE